MRFNEFPNVAINYYLCIFKTYLIIQCEKQEAMRHLPGLHVLQGCLGYRADLRLRARLDLSPPETQTWRINSTVRLIC